MAVDGNETVFKATDYTVDSLFLDRGAGSVFQTLLNTTMLASVLDLGIPLGSFISSRGIERNGFRGGRIAINACFLNAAS